MPNTIREVAEGALQLVAAGLWQSDTGGCVKCIAEPYCCPDEGETLKCHEALATLRTIIDALLAVVEEVDVVVTALAPLESIMQDGTSQYAVELADGCVVNLTDLKASLASIVEGSRE